MIGTIKKKLIPLRDGWRAGRIKSALKAGKTESVARRFTWLDVDHLRLRDHAAWETAREALERFDLLTLQKKDKIRVAFVLYSAAMWSCGELYELFEKDERFEPVIVLSRYLSDGNTTTFPTFQKSLAAFENTPYRVISVPVDTPREKCYEAMGSPDILFYLTPYSTFFPEGQDEIFAPAKALCVYIPYSYMLIAAEEKYEHPGMRLSWRHFSDSQLYRQLLIDHSADLARNTFFLGYPKMDAFYGAASGSGEGLWKSAVAGAKRIIYAPHHSLPGVKNCSARFGTFDKNSRAIFEYAKAHPDTTSWILKPHPNLKKTVLETGFYRSEQEFRNYLAAWDALSNARVVEEGSYVDLFKTSDALIGDSVSFLAEYQFTGKPQLLLTRPDNRFNPFGEKVAEMVYKVPGEDLAGIEDFIDRVVIAGEDPMALARRAFFESSLDYRAGGKPSASRQIYEHIKSAIEKAE